MEKQMSLGSAAIGSPGADDEEANKYVMKADVIDEQKKELKLADLENTRLTHKLEKMKSAVIETGKLALVNIVRGMRQLYLERGFFRWKVMKMRSRNRERFNARMEVLQSQDAAEGADGEGHSLMPRGVDIDNDDDIQVYPNQFQRLYQENMKAQLEAQKVRLSRLHAGEDLDSDSDHYASDEEMEQALRASEDAGRVGVILSYAAGLKLKQKQERWTMAFMRLHNEWQISQISRCAWAFAEWRTFKIRVVADKTARDLGSLSVEHQEVMDRLETTTSKLKLYRQGRVGTYSARGKFDSDDEIDDDYLMLAAFTRKMNINWTKERLCRGCDTATKCFDTAWHKHWSSIFYTWRQNVIKLKLLSHKYTLAELDKFELSAERHAAVDALKDQQTSNAQMQETIETLKRELQKHRRDKAWMERFNNSG
eukprot:TRINITY_DN18982_c0_g1_i1.p1 TRINITY_DN18982_c0_g1~~TRINITY_DN18982_c0_g1_i1.p1  ORF type:complete len:425 (-),score=105.88 TRINITY_DN18982_c0_g1_i1:312-1586(-)